MVNVYTKKGIAYIIRTFIFNEMSSVKYQLTAYKQFLVIVKPHHEEDIFVITRGRGGAEAEV